MTKQCKQCSKTFPIDSWDKAFYATMQVPEPTHCPDCRLQRRLAWRNERALYPRQCDLCTKDILAIYSADSPYTVYCHDCYWGDSWSGDEFGRPIDFSRPFFDQFAELARAVPHAAAYNENPVNSDYVNYCYQVKNGYLVFGSNFTEDCFYSYHLDNCKNCIDCLVSDHLELCSSCLDCSHCYNTHYSQECQMMRDSYFCFDCHNSSNCFGSIGLRNKEYVFFNKQQTPAEYYKKVAQYLQQYTPEKLYQQAEELRYTVPQRPAIITKCEDSSGNHLQNCANAKHCFDSAELHNCKYVIHCTPKANDLMDVYGGGVNVERCYEFVTGYGLNLRFSILCWKSVYNITCSMLTNFSHDCFGCFSLKNAEYAILNKKYTKLEYEKLYKKLITHMQATGEWGEFFPVEKSIFAYNETIADLYFPLHEKDVKARGWQWTTALAKTTGKETVDIATVPRLAAQVDDTICTAIFACTRCQRNFKILPQELAFYKKQQVYIPTQCHECRFAVMNTRRMLYQIWQRQCMCTQVDHGHHSRCLAEFDTSYSPERKEIVYCEQCYQKEIY